MKVIECFGLPYSCKTTLVKKVEALNEAKKIINYRLLTILYLYDTKKISYLEYIYWTKIEKRRELSHKKKFLKRKEKKINFFKNIIGLLLPSKISFLRKVDELFDVHKKEYSNLLNYLNYLAKNYNAKDEIKLILDWLKFEIIGYELKKKFSNKVIFSSEGFYQLCFSLLIRINISKNQINELINLFPKLDHLFITINKSSKIKDIEKYIKNKNKEFIFNKNFIKKYFYTIRLLKKKNNTKIFYFNHNDIDLTFQDIKKLINI